MCFRLGNNYQDGTALERLWQRLGRSGLQDMALCIMLRADTALLQSQESPQHTDMEKLILLEGQQVEHRPWSVLAR